MSESFIEAFEQWLEENNHRFATPIVITSRDPGESLSFRFEGVTPAISGMLNTNGDLGICVDYDNRCWDFLQDFDIAPGRTDKGKYYCRLCEPGQSPHCDTLRELLRLHSFESLLAWVNERFTPGQ